MLLFIGLGAFVVYTERLVAEDVLALDEAFEETAGDILTNRLRYPLGCLFNLDNVFLA